MRKNPRSALVALLLVPFLFQCGETLEPQEPPKPEVIAVTSVRLDKTSLSLKEGDEAQLTATVEPGNASDKSVSWKSSDANVATVSSAGLVKAIDEGKATITVSSGNGKTATCLVTVEKTAPATIPVSSIKLDKTSLSLKEGEEAQLTATVEPDNASDKSVSWKSSNANVATVSSAGLVKAVAEGSATITVSSGNGKTATCQVTVEKVVIPVSSVTLDQSSLSLKEGEEAQLTATVGPDDASDKSVSWKSSDTNVATVSSTGLVKAVAEGNATITVSSGNGKTATCQVTVERVVIPVSSVTLDQSSLTLEEGNGIQLTATVLPEDASDKTILWESSDGAVASVDGTGFVKAIHEGTAQITARAGNASAACSVTVHAKPVIPTYGAVDMGLSVQWANMNLGANDIAEAGQYYAWGETAPKADYSWTTYSLCHGSAESITRYGDMDDTYTLRPEDDAASVAKGDGWRIPTKHEFQELIDNCDLVWSDSPAGYRLVSKINGNELFLPATGHMEGNQLVQSASRARYWTSSTGTYEEEAAYFGMYTSWGLTLSRNSGVRAYGYAIRPVQGKGATVAEAKIVIEKKEFDFGTVKAGETGTIQVSVSNVGTADLNYYVDLPSIVHESDNFSENITVMGNSHGASLTHTLPPGGYDTFTLLYKPTAPGEEAYSKFVIYTNAVNGNKRIQVRGRSASTGPGGGNSNEDIGFGEWNF